MATISKCDLKVFGDLAIVFIDGFRPTPDDQDIDPRGSANWLVTAYGLQSDALDPDESGILWTDYDTGAANPWRFSVLIAADEVDALRDEATQAGYVVRVEPITEPTHYGDGAGVVTILRHPDGWCLAS